MPTPLAIVTASGWKGTSASDTRVCCGTLGYTMRDRAAADAAITCARPPISAAPAQAARPARLGRALQPLSALETFAAGASLQLGTAAGQGWLNTQAIRELAVH